MFRLYPTRGQQQALARAFGCARVVFNDALAARRDAHAAGLPYPKASELSAALTAAKRTPERAWLGGVSAVVLQQSLRDLETAYRAFFDGLAGRRPRVGGLVRENQAVYVEDLCVKGMARTRMAKSVHDAGWSAFTAMLEYKAERYGRTFARVGRAFPSSQLCSCCGHRDGPKPLHVRAWTCSRCGVVHDRDVNAARNILNEGRRITTE